MALVQELASRAATVLENARLYAERTYVAETLQQSLLPASLPDVEGFDIAAIYRPAVGGTEVGGDFYDVFETCGGGWGVAIADVCGKGVEAAAVTALARHTLRAAALHHAAPREMLESVNDALLRHFDGSQFCTVALGVVQNGRHAARLSLTLGGHPCPFLLHADGSVDAVGTRRAPCWECYSTRSCTRCRSRCSRATRCCSTPTARPRRGPSAGAWAPRASSGSWHAARAQNAMEVVANVENAIALRREGDEARRPRAARVRS